MAKISPIKLSPEMAIFRLKGLDDLHNRLLNMVNRSARIEEKRPNLEQALEAVEEEIYELAMFIGLTEGFCECCERPGPLCHCVGPQKT